MSDPRLGLIMLGLIVVTIMMGFPTAFTLMGLGMIFGYIAFWDPFRPRPRGCDPCGRGRDAADAECGLRRTVRFRRDHGGRNFRHLDLAVGHVDCLRGGGRAVDREALRGGDDSGLLPHVFLSGL